MAILGNRVRISGAVKSFFEFCLYLSSKFSGLLLLLLSINLVIYSSGSGGKKLENFTSEISGKISCFGHSIFDPLFSFFASLYGNFYYFSDLKKENLILKETIEKTKKLAAEADSLIRENTELRKLLDIKKYSGYKTIEAKLLSLSENPQRKTLSIEAGEDRGVKRDSIVLSKGFLVGRVIEVGARSSVALLIADPSFRLPAVTARSKIRFVLGGDGNGGAELLYIQGEALFEGGEEVLSSGDGALYPPGIPIGKISKGSDGRFFVAVPGDFFGTDFVSIYVDPKGR